MSFFVPQTEQLTWDEWASAFVGFSNITNVPLPSDESDWKAWADSLQYLPTLEGYRVPEPALFERWQEWAEQLSGSLLGTL